MPSTSSPPSPRLLPSADFKDDMKGFVEHAEEYRIYVELKKQVEKMKQNLLVQDHGHCYDPGLARNPVLEVCETSARTQATKGTLLSKVEKEVATKTMHDPLIELSDKEYVNPVKNENPGVIEGDQKPTPENVEEKYIEHQKSGPIQPGEILEDKMFKKRVELYVQEHIIIPPKRERMADLSFGFYPCTKCEKTLTNKANLRSHLRSCHDIGAHCPKCGKFFTSVKYMRRHLRDVHIGFTFKCGKCYYSFNGESTLDRHMSDCKIHEVESINNQQMSRQCPICHEKFISKSNLKNHAWNIHQIIQVPNDQMTTKPSRSIIFTCKVCDSIFNRKDNLVDHFRTHHEEELLV